MLVQEDKSSWTKIDVSTDKMLTKFITIKGEDVFAKQPYKDLKVSIYTPTRIMIKLVLLSDHQPKLFVP